jgi:hypothetical protein
MVNLSLSRTAGLTAIFALSLPFVAACGLFDGITSDDETSATGDGESTINGTTPTTGEPVESGPAVDLGTAGNYVILAKAGISTVATSSVTGDLGVSPTAASYITGFSLTEDATNTFSTSTQVTGRVFAADYQPPTPANLTTAVGDMESAFTDAAGARPTSSSSAPATSAGWSSPRVCTNGAPACRSPRT